jgi:protoporphyrinogen oxidase
VHLSILGGGAAGLAVGFYARRQGLTSTIYEAAERVGGHCATIRQGDFRFDLGAHRFHDRDPGITADVKALMGTGLATLRIPSKIYGDQAFIDFPLSAVNLLNTLGLARLARTGLDVVTRRLTRQGPRLTTFEQFARYRYGRDISRRFVLDYSEKLWGVRCDQLSPLVSGTRFRGLTLSSLFLESLSGHAARATHLDGSFLYPGHGFGSIVERLARDCDDARICRNSRVSAIVHNGRHIEAVEINGRTRIGVDHVVSTLPLPYFLRIMKPAPPEGILHAADHLAFRDLILVALVVRQRSLTSVGSLYFPDPRLPFTRISEPKNRSRWMAPSDQTSLLVEIPCRPGEHGAEEGDNRLVSIVSAALSRLGLLAERDITDAYVFRTTEAYPILTVGVDATVRRMLTYLGGFGNLSLLGRNATFEYLHLDEVMSRGKDLAATLRAAAGGQASTCASSL